MDLPTLISRTYAFLILRAFGGISFLSNPDSTFCKQTVETLIRRRVLRRLVWVCTVCLRPTKTTLGLHGLKVRLKHSVNVVKILSANKIRAFVTYA